MRRKGPGQEPCLVEDAGSRQPPRLPGQPPHLRRQPLVSVPSHQGAGDAGNQLRLPRDGEEALSLETPKVRMDEALST